ncbi:hypothetical protein vBPaerPs25_43 [Pseudomonas phage vB_Paer_Ps25]|uniref:Uncharacterized protein n=2 Tax=Pakpunavirus TaxID=1921407 RepID=A0AAE9GMB2_9CAUD|nr:hypothetical protein QE347_gp043 [Pseudomonas phage vB_Paer_Ps12]YP_010765536.1 hypothetical protein QE349_gp043 [Pseudomonas phage vB_Paer_PsCh]UOL47499.1 hypothetical protein vBPaerPs12_43 [Pseudomonas phage vB_Paer_Ps12]UOL47687.1 hypothetical protein vBPaerPs25_43 [Pseudomonas phage vB_Paer_Ps25]UOL47874.1 hypothetical protein vBPaerPsCh_43 [Pseudomonas phage vB_Paer_PsCh]
MRPAGEKCPRHSPASSIAYEEESCKRILSRI